MCLESTHTYMHIIIQANNFKVKALENTQCSSMEDFFRLSEPKAKELVRYFPPKIKDSSAT